MADRAIVFVDGNNWYHSLKNAGLADLGRMDYGKISRKLLGPRSWVATRYYVGQVRQQGNPRLYAEQRRFLAGLEATDGPASTWVDSSRGPFATKPLTSSDGISLSSESASTRLSSTT